MATQVHDHTAQLAKQLAQGFAALSCEYQALVDQHRQLKCKFSWLKQQYFELSRCSTPSQDYFTFLQDLENVGRELPSSCINIVDNLANREDMDSKSQATMIRKAQTALLQVHAMSKEHDSSNWNRLSADNSTAISETHKDTANASLEKDFTIPAMPSKLECPFAFRGAPSSPLATPCSSMSRPTPSGRRLHRASFNDPIRAEICGNDFTSGASSIPASGSAAVCPIRFMNEHDPEEVAKYFEKHKHELPRSHEVCITRFQKNVKSIEMLDRKYGNLVSMIQGLGQKHQAWLPHEPEDAMDEHLEGSSEDRAEARIDSHVRKWATTVSASLQATVLPQEQSGLQGHNSEETRIPHFDRHLKEVRVGESPSRPWGIAIPAKYTNADSSSSVGSIPTASPHLPVMSGQTANTNPQKDNECSFDHRATTAKISVPPVTTMPLPFQSPKDVPKQPPPREPPQLLRVHNSRDEDKGITNVVPQLAFNGPVFLGYPPEQLVLLLQSSNIQSMLQ